jgi:hypothetical protein
MKGRGLRKGSKVSVDKRKDRKKKEGNQRHKHEQASEQRSRSLRAKLAIDLGGEERETRWRV